MLGILRTMAIATTEPTVLTAGDTASWQKTLSDYPADAGWVLSYTLINATTKISITASSAGADHLVSVLAATTANWAAGDYDLLGVATKATERYAVATARVTIKPNLAALTTYDGRTSARKMLEAAEAAYQDYLTNNQGHVAEYEIAGRRMKFRSSGEIWQQIEKLRAMVRTEDNAARIAAGLAPKNKLLVRFKQ